MTIPAQPTLPEEPEQPPTHNRPVIRNVVLLVLFLAVVLVGVITVLIPALDEGTENDPNAEEELTSESVDAPSDDDE
ncbi:MAG: hypothetical protein JJ863_29650 [Deltaproteobacteria bacterium]|nr:hypothetical protein [Deltaproteobacteria bacterium]